MPEIIARVLMEGDFVECVRRKRLPLPDGREAMLYAGFLFPIRQPGPHIDVSGENYPFEDVTLLESGAPSNHTIRLYMDCSGNNARLMVDGDAVVRDFVAATLDEAAVLAEAIDTLNAPADDGRRYDWCFEFEKDPLAEELKQSLGEPNATLLRGDDGDGLTSANVEVSAGGLKQVRELSVESDACRLITARFRNLLSVDTTRRGSGGGSRSAVDMAGWRQQVKNGPQIAKDLLELLTATEHTVRQMDREKADLIRERDRLQIRVSRKVSVSAVLAEVFPEIDFVRDSALAIDNDFSSVRMLAFTLKAILSNDPSTRTNPVRGAKTEWFEVHVATGTRSNGRIYFHRVSPSQVKVLVSFKVDQKHDTTWIRSLS
jgi:hypothetical protein